MQISVWLSDNIGIGFFYDQRTPGDGDYVIQFADRAVSVMPYVTSNAYDQQITLVAAVLALAAALLIIAPYARRISSDIKHLSGDMALIAGGDLTHEVKLKGKTELAELAQSFDQMRLAIAARMERESEAVRANQELIGALSHDLRTPLTKQSSYLELALSERYREDAKGMRACVERAAKATGELRERIEELFFLFPRLLRGEGAGADAGRSGRHAGARAAAFRAGGVFAAAGLFRGQSGRAGGAQAARVSAGTDAHFRQHDFQHTAQCPAGARRAHLCSGQRGAGPSSILTTACAKTPTGARAPTSAAAPPPDRRN